jgi:hypothetical protein
MELVAQAAYKEQSDCVRPTPNAPTALYNTAREPLRMELGVNLVSGTM